MMSGAQQVNTQLLKKNCILWLAICQRLHLKSHFTADRTYIDP